MKKVTDFNNSKLIFFILICIIFATLIRVLKKSLLISTGHIDGVYQTFNALARISVGDLPGWDFYPYLGLGPTFVLYPIFELIGGNVFASQLSANLITKIFWIAGLLTLSIFSPLRELPRKKFLVVLLLLYIIFGLQVFPGNSLLVVRGFVTIIAAWSVQLFLLQKNKPFLYGVAMGFVLLWSNDYGIPTVITMLLVLFMVNFSGSKKKNILVSIFSFALIAPALLYVVSGGHVVQYFNYTADVAADQFWYFASYGRDSNYYGLFDLLMFWRRYDSILGSIALLTSIPLLMFLMLDAVRNKRQCSYILTTVGLSALGAGLLSEIGGHKSIHYYRMLFSVYPFLLLQFVYVVKPQWVPYYNKYHFLKKVILNWGLNNSIRYMLMFVFMASMIAVVLETKKVFSIPDSAKYVDELGGYFSDKSMPLVKMSADIKNRAVKNGSEFHLLSEYSGIPNAIIGEKNELKSDSIIHVLGPNIREQYYNQITQAIYQYATTTNPNYSIWQKWGLFQNWRFYKYIIENYKPHNTTNELVFWSLRSSELNKRSDLMNNCSVEEVTPSRVKIMMTTTGEKSLYEVKLHYSLSFERTWLPIVGNNRLIRVESDLLPNEVGNAFSIAPYLSLAEFPVVLENDIAQSFLLVADPEDRSTLKIEKCEMRFITSNLEVIDAIYK